MKKVDKPLGLGECLPDVEQRQLDAGEGANLAQNGITSRHSFTPDQEDCCACVILLKHAWFCCLM